MRPRYERQACQAEGLPALERGRASRSVGSVKEERMWARRASVISLLFERLDSGASCCTWRSLRAVGVGASRVVNCGDVAEEPCLGVVGGDVASPSPIVAEGGLSKLLLGLS